MIKSFFKLQEYKTTIRTEVVAGITTFMTMAYILAVNPAILSETGMDKNALFTATALSAGVATLVMALWARLPFALAPGMGVNAFFAFTICKGMGYSWELALAAVFLEGIIFMLLTFFNVRELIVNSIPMGLKNAISAGLGLFIAFIGMQSAGLIVANDNVIVAMGDLKSVPVLLTLLGFVLTGVLLALKVKGALLVGIIVITLTGIPFGITQLPEGSIISLPPDLSPIAFKFDFAHIFSSDMFLVLFTLLFLDMFNTVGTLVGVASKTNMMNEKGEIPRVRQALFADAIGTTAGALMGTSTVTTYVESASGVLEGGRTGLTALTTAILFFLALFVAPVFLMVPAVATAPILMLVGVFMMEPILKIDFSDYTEAIPAFLAIILMPLAYSVVEGITFGVMSYVILKVLSGRYKELSIVIVVLAVLFALKYFVF
ncbi:NCS2 family permease [Marinilabiliaceae bacterium JC017]|nr:NCS2 family permease [Marinilabiliaceae bacterium JC017]